MNSAHHIDLAWRSVVAVHGRGGVVGTGVVVAENEVLTALHVVDPERTVFVSAPDQPHPVIVHATTTLPLRKFGPTRGSAVSAYRRFRDLTEEDLGTVDLALLAVPDLCTPPIPLRRSPVQRAEWVAIAGYPGGDWAISAGPVAATDGSGFVAHLLLGPGASGAPVVDRAGYLVGLASLDHPDVGILAIGPPLLAAFLDRTSGLLSARAPRHRDGMRRAAARRDTGPISQR